MEKVKKSININEHITNIECKIETEFSGQKIASISFDNMSYGVITAVKFKARGYNSFGDLIKIADKEEYLVIIEDLNVEKNKSLVNFKVKLPSQEIRKIELEECQILYDSGEVLTYEGKKDIEFELEKFSEEGEEGKILFVLRILYSPKIRYNLLETNNGWICTCGGFNKKENIVCVKCGQTKKDIEFYLSDECKKSLINTKEFNGMINVLFEKVENNEVNKAIEIIGDNNSEGKITFLEAVIYMENHGIKVDGEGSLLASIKKTIETQHYEIHNAMCSLEDIGLDYRELLVKERTYLSALNRIEQYETKKALKR